MGRFTSGSRRRALAVIFAGMLAALTMAFAAPAQATPNLAKAWGLNSSGQLGTGTTEGPEQCGVHKEACSASPIAVSGLTGASAVAGGDEHSLALLEGGAVVAWGRNGQGQLGNGTTVNSDVPVSVSGLSGAIAVAAGAGFSLALLSNHTVMAWGSNNEGQLGDGSTQNSDVPVPVSNLSEVTAIAAGGRHALAQMKNGTVVAWGSNFAGQLGNGTTNQSDVPVTVTGLGEPATAIAAGDTHSLARLASGALMAWGTNGQGQLGDGGEANSDVPVAVSGLAKVAAIAAGANHSLALLEATGNVMAWGYNAYGQLGGGTSIGPETCGLPPTTPCAKKPTEVSGLSAVSAITAGGNDGLALLEGGRLVAWGENLDGQLGTGSSTGPEVCGAEATSCSSKPVEVSKALGASGIAAGEGFSLAFGPPPTVTAVKPKKGPVTGGTSVTITGEDFTGAKEVKFGSTAAASFTVDSDTKITAVTPSAALVGRVHVTVSNDWGTSAKSKADAFTFAPVVSSVSPNTGSTAGGESVMVTGAGFLKGTKGTQFRFGTVLAPSLNCTSTTSCKVTTPPHADGTVDVKANVKGIGSLRNRPGDQLTYS
jgi:alpha-tubulin suppressor-like RCC1 family protein